MSLKEKLQELKNLNFPPDQFVVVSSGALAVRGIREAKDLDVIVSDNLWAELKNKYLVKNDTGFSRIEISENIEILGDGSTYTNSSVVSFDEIFEKSDVFEDIKFINLQHLKKIKAKLSRPIDIEDIKLIDSYLNKDSGVF